MQHTDIVFDIDGTLTDSNHIVKETLIECGHEYLGRELTQEELMVITGLPCKSVIKKLGMPSKACLRWLSLIESRWDDVRLFEGVEELLYTLKDKGYRLGIITSQDRSEYEAGFAKFEVASLFDCVICGDDCALHKPHPGIFAEYMRCVDTYEERVCYVGDTLADMNCAMCAGVFGVQALWDGHEALSKDCDYAIKKPQDLLEILGN